MSRRKTSSSIYTLSREESDVGVIASVDPWAVSAASGSVEGDDDGGRREDRANDSR